MRREGKRQQGGEEKELLRDGEVSCSRHGVLSARRANRNQLPPSRRETARLLSVLLRTVRAMRRPLERSIGGRWRAAGLKLGRPANVRVHTPRSPSSIARTFGSFASVPSNVCLAIGAH